MTDGSGRRRSEKPTAPRPTLGQLGRKMVNRALAVAEEAANQLLVIGANKDLTDLTHKTIDYQEALEAYKAYEKAHPDDPKR